MSNKKKKKAIGLLTGPDVSLDYFANSANRNTARLRKSESSGSLAAGSMLGGEDAVLDNWEEEEGEDDGEESGEVPELLANLSVGKSSRRRRGENAEKSPQFQVQVFPYDFWDLLSNYIKPETIGTFARICKVTNYIVSSQSFWRRLYSRYYNPTAELPIRFQPDCMQRPKGLKACVIRMLHLCHTPFLSLSDNKHTVWPDLDVLVGSICVIQWASKLSKNQCFFYFKLRDPSVIKRSYSSTHAHLEEADEELVVDEDFMADISDINYNTENGCKLLQVSGVSWCQLPPLLGMCLLQVGVSVSQGMRHHKLLLEFGGVEGGRARGQQDRVTVIIDSVVNLKVINWWNPQYKEKPPAQPARKPLHDLADPFS